MGFLPGTGDRELYQIIGWYWVIQVFTGLVAKVGDMPRGIKAYPQIVFRFGV
jgi:hypothetical protein